MVSDHSSPDSSGSADSPGPEHDADGRWLLRLTGSGQHVPASHPPLVALARDVLGAGPVDWAVDLGHEMASTIVAEMSDMAGGEEALQTVRMGTEASSLHSMLMLVSGDVAASSVPEESLEGDRDFVRRGIRLDRVLHGIRLGHSIMARALLDAASVVVDEPLRTLEMKRTSELLHRYMDDFASTMSDEYIAEHDRWVTSAAAERAELVRTILAGEPAVTVPGASATLGYPLERHHLAAVVWRDPGGAETPSDLQRVAARVFEGSGCSSTLVVPNGASSVWVWSSWRSQEKQRPELVMPEIAGINVALGTMAPDLSGFRQSHREAIQVTELIRTGGAGSAASMIHWFSDMELTVLLSQDLDLARTFVVRELGSLAEDSPDAAELRETMAAYLACDRSLARSAEILHVARNTVAYRVKKVENKTGRDLRERRLELECALRLAESLGAPALGP